MWLTWKKKENCTSIWTAVEQQVMIDGKGSGLSVVIQLWIGIVKGYEQISYELKKDRQR